MCTGTDCRTTPQQLTDVLEPCSSAWLCGLDVAAGGSTEHYAVNTAERYGELVSIIVSVRHRHATQQWFLQRVIVISDPHQPQRAVRCFPCHDVVQARVTLRTGNGTTDRAWITGVEGLDR